MYYILNHDSVIFLDSDAQEGYKTIAYDWKNDKIFEVSPALYHLLQALDSLGRATEEDLEKWIKTFSANRDFVEKAIDDLIARGVIVRYEY